MSIGAAIIGSGLFAKEEHLPAILASPDFTLKAVYSRSLASASSLSEGLEQKIDWYSDETDDQERGFDALLAREDITAVIIALPIMNQPEYIRKALKAGKHVLAEKPIANDVATATELLEWYHKNVDTSKVTWSVAENFRFFDSYTAASEEISKLGRLLGFRLRVSAMVEAGNKWYETSWRKTPTHQGGFILDGGIHSIAGLRLMLAGAKEDIVRVSAFTSQLQPHMPPIDSVDATCKTTSGVAGIAQLSFGTTFKGGGISVACEHGVVTVVGKDVTIEKNGVEETKTFPRQTNGVKEEVLAWGKAILAGKPDARQSPEEALRDLRALEAMFKSGEKGGEPLDTGN